MSTLRIVAAPAVGLAVLLTMAVAFEVVVTLKGGSMSNGAAHLYNAAWAFIVSWAVELDRRAQGISAPFEFSAFVFFFWWAVLPYYLYKTRKWRGLGITFAAMCTFLLPYLVALGVYAVVA